MENILVSIICITFNQEKYIAQALDSLINQKTKYKYEIIVHDDASTDSTPNIIKEYAKKYPDKIVAVYEKENQHDKIVKTGKGTIIGDLCFPLAKGKYIAFCEGDDYWITEDCIEKKVAFLESHPEYCALLHRTHFFDCKENKFFAYSNPSTCEYDFTLKDAVFLRSHTTGWMIRKDIYEIELPKHLKGYRKFTDQGFGLYTALVGKVRYIPDVMSVWRKGVEGSYTSRHQNFSKKEKNSHYKKRVAFYKYLVDTLPKEYKIYAKNEINELKISHYKFKHNYFLYAYHHFNGKRLLRLMNKR